MIEIIIWFASIFCPNPNHTASDHGKCKLVHVTINNTGGETGGNPPPPPPPPPPGGGG